MDTAQASGARRTGAAELARLIDEAYVHIRDSKRIVPKFLRKEQANRASELIKELLDERNVIRVQIHEPRREGDYFVPLIRVHGTGDAYGMPIFRGCNPEAVWRSADGCVIEIASLRQSR